MFNEAHMFNEDVHFDWQEMPFFNHFPMKPAVVYQLLSKFGMFTWVGFWTIRFKNLIISFHQKKSPLQYTSPPNFHCFHKRLPPSPTPPPPPLNIHFHVINQNKTSFLVVVIPPVLFSLSLCTLCMHRSC